MKAEDRRCICIAAWVMVFVNATLTTGAAVAADYGHNMIGDRRMFFSTVSDDQQAYQTPGFGQGIFGEDGRLTNAGAAQPEGNEPFACGRAAPIPSIPEPGSKLMIATGLALMAFVARRRKHQPGV
jgi:hypothetical protein